MAKCLAVIVRMPETALPLAPRINSHEFRLYYEITCSIRLRISNDTNGHKTENAKYSCNVLKTMRVVDVMQYD